MFISSKKALLLLLIFYICSTFQVSAQVIPKFGLKGGLNVTTITKAEGEQVKPGFTSGAFLNINIPLSPFAVQPEVLYSQYGIKSNGSGDEFQLDYIQVPVLLKVELSPPLILPKPNFYAGPYMGFNTKANFVIEGEDNDMDQMVRDSEIGLVAGVGLDVLNVKFDLRYTIGMTTLYEEELEDGQRNMGLALTVGFSF